MSSSFLLPCFMKDITTMIVNHKLVLYSMSFLLFARIIHFPSILIYWSWNLLFCRICESHKTWKILFYFLLGLKPLCNIVYLLWNWYTLYYHIQYSIFNIQSFVYPCRCCSSDLNQRESLLMCTLCKGDNISKALEIYLLNPS
jgi:hypothetical protein